MSFASIVSSGLKFFEATVFIVLLTIYSSKSADMTNEYIEKTDSPESPLLRSHL